MRKIKLLFMLLSIVAANTSATSTKYEADAKIRMTSFVLPNTLSASLFADQSQTQNPSFFTFDSKGRMLITEVDRIAKGVDDVRSFSAEKLLDDIYIETSADRLAMFEKYSATTPMSYYTSATDQIRLVQDKDGDGRADHSNIFATNFKEPLAGLGVGVIERDGNVFYTNIPHLWLLEDQNDDGIADKRTSLQDGFGTRVSFMGHDMHGLTWGPDGRLYWSIGDRGYSFTTKEGNKLHKPNYGAVFRANADGSNIEVFYTGVRNPQELVFDEYGNLFTADNDGDKSDIERINHLIEGGHSGWHAGHQSIMNFTKTLSLRSYQYTGDANVPVSWLVNDMSRARNANQPAYMLPGIGQLYTGPSGLTYNPSNYLGEQYRHSFFVSLFTGSTAGSYVNTFKTIANGASFLTTNMATFFRGINSPDVDFGPDGRLYLSEFNYGGWSSQGEGAIYAIDEANPSEKTQARNKRFHQLLTSDLSKKTIEQLSELLAIDHQKIRQNAQFELAKRGAPAVTAFMNIANNPAQPVFSRIHSIWGLSQMVFETPLTNEVLTALVPLIQDNSAQVRIQVARVLGDHNAHFASNALTVALNDKHPQVKMYAAIAIGRIGAASAVSQLIRHIEENGGQDLWLRHAYVMALAGIDKQHWIKHKTHASKEVRLAILLALRKLADNEVSSFLQDKNSALVEEAIVAITDQNLLSERAKVAALLNADLAFDTPVKAYFHHRLINANYNEGEVEHAARTLHYASQNNLPPRLISEALAAIEGWHDVNPIDTITGLPTLANKNRADITKAVEQYLPHLFAHVKGEPLVQVMRLAQQYHYTIPSSSLLAIANNTSATADIRTQSLTMLATRTDVNVEAAAKALTTDKNTLVATTALAVLVTMNEPVGISQVVALLTSPKIQDNTVGLLQAKSLRNEQVDNLLAQYFSRLLAGKLSNALTLELLEALENSENTILKAHYQRYQNDLNTQPLMEQYRSTLAGGNAQIGKEIFHGGGAAQCIRCHKVNYQGQSNVGPDLTGLASRYNKDYILQALIEPSAAVAPGFGTVTLTLANNEVISGQFSAESSDVISLINSSEEVVHYQKNKIKHLQRPMSGMPPMNYVLSKRQIRDLMAYLTQLKSNAPRKGH